MELRGSRAEDSIPDRPVVFLPEREAPREPLHAGETGWKILIVDDDENFQKTLLFALQNFRYQNHSIQILRATSAQEAALIFARETDIAVALLDVVMETDDAGLRLVRNVREILGNAETRIALVTGQPGLAPLQASVTDYDIDDYWLKTDLTADKLRGMLTTRLRDWQRLTAINRARRGLQMIVEGSNAFADSRTLAEFSTRMVMELARLLGVPEEGIVCVMEDGSGSPMNASIIAAAGGYTETRGHMLSTLENERVRDALVQCLARRQDIVLPHGLVFYFACRVDTLSCAAYVEDVASLDPTQQDLLRVFTTHINSALVNVSLISKLDRMAYFDPLVDLPNRNALLRAISALMSHACAHSHSLVLLDIDDFSGINYALGFEHGNMVLCEMARRLQGHFMPPIIVSRIHDDVFALLGPTELISEDRLAALVAGSAGDAEGRFISLAIGRLDLADFAGSAEEAMAMSSLVLKSAKRGGYGRCCRYEPQMGSETRKRLEISEALHRALEAGDITIALQPQVRLSDGKVLSAEVLARWKVGDREISPVEFIPVAEANGDILELGNQVFRQAIFASCFLASEGFPEMRLAVNVSPPQLAHEGLMRRWLSELSGAGITPGHIEIEVTESLAMQGDKGALERLSAFHQAGFPIAIDDFGTGYSSLARLRTLPIDVLKIDRAFINEIGQGGDGIIAEAILAMAIKLGLTVVAEGVETAEQAVWLKMRGCTVIQGYYYARPMTLEDFANYLRGHS